MLLEEAWFSAQIVVMLPGLSTAEEICSWCSSGRSQLLYLLELIISWKLYFCHLATCQIQACCQRAVKNWYSLRSCPPYDCSVVSLNEDLMYFEWKTESLFHPFLVREKQRHEQQGTQPFLPGYISAKQQDFGSRAFFIKQTIFINYGRLLGLLLLNRNQNRAPMKQECILGGSHFSDSWNSLPHFLRHTWTVEDLRRPDEGRASTRRTLVYLHRFWFFSVSPDHKDKLCHIPEKINNDSGKYVSGSQRCDSRKMRKKKGEMQEPVKQWKKTPSTLH